MTILHVEVTILLRWLHWQARFDCICIATEIKIIDAIYYVAHKLIGIYTSLCYHDNRVVMVTY